MWIISKRDSIYKDVAYIWLPWCGIYKQAPSSPALACAQATADGTDCEHESYQGVLGTNNTLNCLWAWEPCTSSLLLLLLLPVQTAGGLVLLALFRFPHVKVNLSSTPPQTPRYSLTYGWEYPGNRTICCCPILNILCITYCLDLIQNPLNLLRLNQIIHL